MRALFALLALSLPALASAQTPIPSPAVTGPVTGGVRTGFPYNHTLFDLSRNGYVEQDLDVRVLQVQSE